MYVESNASNGDLTRLRCLPVLYTFVNSVLPTKLRLTKNQCADDETEKNTSKTVLVPVTEIDQNFAGYIMTLPHVLLSFLSALAEHGHRFVRENKLGGCLSRTDLQSLGKLVFKPSTPNLNP